MILDNRDINNCKCIINRIRVKAFLHNDTDVINFTNMMFEMIDFYESHMNSWEYTSHHDRQAMNFLKRLAITESKFNNKYPEYFEDEFFHLISDYPAVKRRFNEWSKGDNI